VLLFKSRNIITNSEALLQIPRYYFKFRDITKNRQTVSSYSPLYLPRIIPNIQLKITPPVHTVSSNNQINKPI